jgi:uncharacterized delta-60 repeat protein
MKTYSKFLLAAFLLLSTHLSAQDGLPDNTFNSTGTKLVNFSPYTNFQDVLVQPDGKIVVVGSASTNSDYDFLIARYNDDGSPDNTFGTNGSKRVDFGSTFDQAIAVALQPDGKIIAGGKAISGGVAFDYALARFMPNGSLDSTFGTNGKTTIDFNGNNDEATKMVLQPDGKILLVGSTSNQLTGGIGLIRCLSNGVLDNTFNSTGRVETLSDSGTLGGNDVALQADGKIVVASSRFTNGMTTLRLVRYNANGLVDSTFATYGLTELPLLGGSSSAASVAIQPDGKIVVTGAWVDNTNNAIVARYMQTGTLDGSFGTLGKVILDWGAMDNTRSVLVQPDGKIIICGAADNVCKVAKLDSSGNYDAIFGVSGIASTDLSVQNELFNAVTLDTAGKVLAVGNAGLDAGMARYTNTVQVLPNAVTDLSVGLVKVYPNPVSNRLIINAKGEQITEVNIYSLSGQIISSHKSIDNEVSMEGLYNGVYLVEVVTAAHVYKNKIVKVD